MAQAQVVHIQGQVTWEWYMDQASRRWIAICRALKLVLEADTHSELVESIADSMRLLLRSVYEDGEFDQFMTEQGWHGNVPRNVNAKNIRFDVPMEIIKRQQQADDSARQPHQ